jgi:flagellar assembly protein FliH
MVSAPRIATYAFEQLDSSAQSQLGGGIADVLSAAWAEAEQVREQARQEGLAAGRAEGIAAAQADATPALASLGEAVRAVESLHEELIATLERQAAELALRVSEQILGAAVEVQPARVVEVARGALRRLADRNRVTVLVNPADLELMAEAVAGLQSELGGIDHLDVQADRRIERGGAVARTEFGEIDASLTAQLQSAREIVFAALQGGDGEDAATDAD